MGIVTLILLNILAYIGLGFALYGIILLYLEDVTYGILTTVLLLISIAVIVCGLLGV